MALWVVVAHYTYIGPFHASVAYPPAGGAIAAFAGNVGIALSVFFTMSGFLMMQVTEKAHPVRYMVARFNRLAPGFWIAMTASAILLQFVPGNDAPDLSTWIANLVLVPQVFGYEFVDGVYWTLVVEVVFYFLIAILLIAGQLHHRTLGICIGWCAIALANIHFLDEPILQRVLITNHAGAFASGMVMWHGVRHGWSPLAIGALALAIYSMAAGFGVFGQITFEGGKTEAFTIWQLVAMSAGTAALVLAALQWRAPATASTSMSARAKAWQSLALYLGAISYPLYLFHQEVGYALINRLPSGLSVPMRIGAASVFVVTMSGLMAVLLEAPARRLLARMTAPLASSIAGSMPRRSCRNKDLAASDQGVSYGPSSNPT